MSRRFAPRAVVFDLDGTLLATEEPYRVAFLRALAEHETAMSAADYASLVGLSSRDRRARLRSLLGDAFPIDAFLATYRAHREGLLVAGPALKPGALALLAALDVPLGIATSASRATATRRLHAVGLSARFTTVVTRDDVARGKPDPEPFRLAAARLGAPPGDCAALEDSEHGARSAIAAGLRTILVTDRTTPLPAIAACCWAVVHGLTEAERLLGQPVRGSFVHGLTTYVRVAGE